jgi:hypothetical protein
MTNDGVYKSIEADGGLIAFAEQNYRTYKRVTQQAMLVAMQLAT